MMILSTNCFHQVVKANADLAAVGIKPFFGLSILERNIRQAFPQLHLLLMICIATSLLRFDAKVHCCNVQFTESVRLIVIAVNVKCKLL